MPPDLDRGGLPPGVERQELLAVGRGVLLVVVEDDGGGHERQLRVGIDGVPVGLDDVDRVAACALVVLGDRALDVDHARCEVEVGAPCRRARQGKGLVDAGVLAAGGDDRRDARAVGRQHGGVDRVVLDVTDRDEPADLAVDVQRARDLAGVRVDEGHAPVRAGDDAGAGRLAQLADPG